MEIFMNVEMICLSILFIFSIFALYFDLKFKIIPNQLNIIFFIVGIILHVYLNHEKLFSLFSNLIFMLIIGILLNVIKVIAMGDLKYYLVTTVIIGFQNSLIIIFLTLIFGVPLGCIYVIVKHGISYTISTIKLNLMQLFISPTNMNQLTKFPLMVASFPATLVWIVTQMNGVEQFAPFNVVLSKILNFILYR